VNSNVLFRRRHVWSGLFRGVLGCCRRLPFPELPHDLAAAIAIWAVLASRSGNLPASWSGKFAILVGLKIWAQLALRFARPWISNARVHVWDNDVHLLLYVCFIPCYLLDWICDVSVNLFGTISVNISLLLYFSMKQKGHAKISLDRMHRRKRHAKSCLLFKNSRQLWLIWLLPKPNRMLLVITETESYSRTKPYLPKYWNRIYRKPV
jgi:hypothetical protein